MDLITGILLMSIATGGMGLLMRWLGLKDQKEMLALSVDAEKRRRGEEQKTIQEATAAEKKSREQTMEATTTRLKARGSQNAAANFYLQAANAVLQQVARGGGADLSGSAQETGAPAGPAALWAARGSGAGPGSPLAEQLAMMPPDVQNALLSKAVAGPQTGMEMERLGRILASQARQAGQPPTGQ